MSHLSHITLKTICILCCIHSWCILLVLGGCRRTNPGWAASDHMKEHLTAPSISFVPGNFVNSLILPNTPMHSINTYLVLQSVSVFILTYIGSNNFNAAWNESLVSVYDQCYDEVQIWVQKRGKHVVIQ